MSVETISSAESPRSRRVLWWGMLGGAGLLLCGLAVIVGVTRYRGQLQQQRVEALLRLKDVDIYQSHSAYGSREAEAAVLRGVMLGAPGLRTKGAPLPPHVRWLKPILGEQGLVQTTRIVVSSEEFSDAEMPLLLAFRELPELEIFSHRLSDGGVRQLIDLRRLAVLRVPNVPLSTETIRRLSACRQLRELWINTSLVDAEVVAELQRELPDCQIEVWPPPSFGMRENPPAER